MENPQSQLTGRIVLERVRDTRPIRSFIAKKLKAWFESHGIGANSTPVYCVALNRAGQGHFFTCRIEVDTSETHWEAMVTQKDLHRSIIEALEHLSAKRRNYVLQPA
jgi:hypothetical protein